MCLLEPGPACAAGSGISRRWVHRQRCRSGFPSSCWGAQPTQRCRTLRAGSAAGRTPASSSGHRPGAVASDRQVPAADRPLGALSARPRVGRPAGQRPELAASPGLAVPLGLAAPLGLAVLPGLVPPPGLACCWPGWSRCGGRASVQRSRGWPIEMDRPGPSPGARRLGPQSPWSRLGLPALPFRWRRIRPGPNVCGSGLAGANPGANPGPYPTRQPPRRAIPLLQPRPSPGAPRPPAAPGPALPAGRPGPAASGHSYRSSVPCRRCSPESRRLRA